MGWKGIKVCKKNNDRRLLESIRVEVFEVRRNYFEHRMGLQHSQLHRLYIGIHHFVHVLIL